MDQQTSTKYLAIGGIAIGVWLLLSPVILSYHSFEAFSQQIIIGLIVTLIAGVRLVLPAVTWPSIIIAILGVQLILMTLSISDASAIIQRNATLSGLALLIGALYRLHSHRTVLANRHYHFR